MEKFNKKIMKKVKSKWVVASVTLVAAGFIGAAMPTEASAAEWTARSPQEIAIPTDGQYTIIWGDTLWAISESSGVSIDSLVQMNDIANRDLIYAGNLLTVKGNVVTVTEQNGHKEAFKIEGNNVSKATKEDVAKAEKSTSTATNKVVNVTPAKGSQKDSEKSGHTDKVVVSAEKDSKDKDKHVASSTDDNKSDAPVKEDTPVKEDSATEKPSDNNGVKPSTDKEDQGGNFAPSIGEGETVTPDKDKEEGTDKPATPEVKPEEKPNKPSKPVEKPEPEAPVTPEKPKPSEPTVKPDKPVEKPETSKLTFAKIKEIAASTIPSEYKYNVVDNSNELGAYSIIYSSSLSSDNTMYPDSSKEVLEKVTNALSKAGIKYTIRAQDYNWFKLDVPVNQ